MDTKIVLHPTPGCQGLRQLTTKELRRIFGPNARCTKNEKNLFLMHSSGKASSASNNLPTFQTFKQQLDFSASY